MQVCKDCGTESPVTAIHCVSCGKPFNYAKRSKKPTTIETELLFTKEQWPSVVIKSLKCVLLAVLLVPLLALTPKILKPELDFALRPDAGNRFDKLIKYPNQNQTFSEKELVYLFKSNMITAFLKKAKSNSEILPRDLSIDAKEGNRIKVTVKYQTLKGRLPLYASFVLNFTNIEDENCRITVSKKRIGMLPALTRGIFQPFTLPLESDFFIQEKMSKVLNKLKSVTTTDSEVTIQTY